MPYSFERRGKLSVIKNKPGYILANPQTFFCAVNIGINNTVKVNPLSLL
jgi:hypothetical protein